MGMRTLAPVLVMAAFAFSAHGEGPRMLGQGVEGSQQQQPQQSKLQQMQGKVNEMIQAAADKKSSRGATSDASAEAGKAAQAAMKAATDKQEAESKKVGDAFLQSAIKGEQKEEQILKSLTEPAKETAASAAVGGNSDPAKEVIEAIKALNMVQVQALVSTAEKFAPAQTGAASSKAGPTIGAQIAGISPVNASKNVIAQALEQHAEGPDKGAMRGVDSKTLYNPPLSAIPE